MPPSITPAPKPAFFPRSHFELQSQYSTHMNNHSHAPASFLFTTWEGGGNVSPALTVARKLVERGHRVRFMSDLVNRADAKAAGTEFRPWTRAPSRPDRTRESCPVRDWEATNPTDGIGRLIDKIMLGPALYYAQDVIDELEREPADVVVTSEMLPGVMAACESRQQRMAVFAANLCFYPLPGMPCFGPGLPPPQTEAEEALHQQIIEGTIAMFDTGLESLNNARLALGLLPLAHAVDQIHSAELYLLGTSRAFDFPVAQLPDQIRYVGPQLDEPAWARAWTPPWQQTDRRPLIAVGFSTTYQDHTGVLQNVMDAAAALPVRTLVTLGQVLAWEVSAPENAVLLPSAPHNAVMGEAAVVVTHGGHGTVMRALLHQRPMLIIPHGRDQHENAVRVTERGAGLCLPATASREEIENALRRLLEDPSFAAAARQLGSAIVEDMRRSSVLEPLELLAARTHAERRKSASYDGDGGTTLAVRRYQHEMVC